MVSRRPCDLRAGVFERCQDCTELNPKGIQGRLMKSPRVSRGYDRYRPRNIGGRSAQLVASAPAKNAADWDDECLLAAVQELAGPLARNSLKLMDFS